MNFLKFLVSKVARFFAWILWMSPFFVRRFLGGTLGFLWFDLFRIRRDVAINNILLAFPKMSKADATKLGRKSLRNLGINFVEYCFLPFLNSRHLMSVIDIEGHEQLDQALEKGKGVLMLTLHLGHGDIAVGGLSVLGYPMVLVSKFFKLKWLNDLWFGMRSKLGTEFIPPRDSSFQLLKKLRANKVIVIPLDQFTGPPIGVRTTFFGVETGTAAGLALMALRSGAQVVLAYTYRKPSGKHQIKVDQIVDLEPFKTQDDPTHLATQHFNHLLEEVVRKHPDQWMWIHRRWKKFVVN